MEEDIDKLIEDIETLNVEINRTNFEIDGLTEDVQEIEDKRPFLVRQLQMKTRKLQKLSVTLMRQMRLKQDLDARLQAYQVAKSADNFTDNKPVDNKPKDNSNIPETPKQ